MNNSNHISAALQKRLDAIHTEVCELHFKWKFFSQLFTDKQRFEILKKTAPSLFSYVQDLILHDMMLGIARLTDPHKLKGRSNLSFDTILPEITDVTLRAEISEIILKIKSKTTAIRDWRNKKLAHNDLAKLLEGNPLPPVYIRDLREILNLASQVLNIFYTRFQDTEVRYDDCVTSGDGDSLLFYLEYGLDAWEDDKGNHNLDRLNKLNWQRTTQKII
jgi:AbiU2